MDDTANQRSIAWMFGLIVLALAIGGGLVVGMGSGEPSAVDELPAAPVRGMADRDASALPAGDAVAGRPVLQVTAGPEQEASPSPTSVATTQPPSTAAPVTVSVVPSTSPTTVPAVDPAPTTATSPTSTPTDPSSTVADPTTSMPPVSDPTTSTTGPGGLGTGLNPVESELARLTNELRTNPNGLLRRQGPVINCDGRVPIDPASGLYQPLAALTIDPTASTQVAREWSAQLTTDLQHRPQAGIAALQGAGLDVAAAGENIAYHNFPDTAMRHFVGWRESDGHFCNMMDPTFTHLGVGEVTRTDGFSFATQNFFSLRASG